MVYGKECGRPPLQGNRIVGGADAAMGAWPWQVDVQVGPSKSQICKIVFYQLHDIVFSLVFPKLTS